MRNEDGHDISPLGRGLGPERTTPGGLIIPAGLSYESPVMAEVIPVAQQGTALSPAQPDSTTSPAFAELLSRLFLQQAGGMAGDWLFATSNHLKRFHYASVDAFAEQAEAWIARHAGADKKTKRTAAARRDGLRAFLRYLRSSPEAAAQFIGGDSHLQANAILGWNVWLNQQVTPLGEPLSPRSANAYYRSTRVVVKNLALEAEAFNPFLGLPAPKPGRPDHPRIPVAKIQDLLEAVDDAPWRSELERTRNAVIFRLYAVAGMRLEEPLEIRNGDVNLDIGEIHLRKTKGPHGGGNRDVQCPTFRDVLRRYMVAKERAGRNEPQFLISIRQKGGIGKKTIRRLCDRFEPVIGKHVTALMFRRTAIDMMRMSGLSNETICRQVGNSAAMTSYYSEVSSDELRQAMTLVNPEALRAALRPGGEQT